MEFLKFVLLIVILLIVVYIRMNNTVRYYVEPSNVDPAFAQTVQTIIQNTNWLNKCTPVVSSKNAADITIKLASRDELDRWHSGNGSGDKRSELDKYPDGHHELDKYPDGRPIRFSITTRENGENPRIYIDSLNWLYGVPESGLTLQEYRNYVIRHEFMHGLGYDHQPCNAVTSINGRCPVLYQATRGCPVGFRCGSEVTPVDFTKRL